MKNLAWRENMNREEETKERECGEVVRMLSFFFFTIIYLILANPCKEGQVALC